MRDTIAKALLSAVKKLTPEGFVLDLRAGSPHRRLEHLIGAKVLGGHSRGTHVFKIVRINWVDPNVVDPFMSIWSATAVSISEKNGKEMSSVSHGANSSSDGVEIQCSLGQWLPVDDKNDDTEAPNRRLLDLIQSTREADQHQPA